MRVQLKSGVKGPGQVGYGPHSFTFKAGEPQDVPEKIGEDLLRRNPDLFEAAPAAESKETAKPAKKTASQED